MKNKIEDLRNHLFEVIERLKDGDMDIERAKTISDVAQTIVNSAKVEVQFLSVAQDAQASEFFSEKPALPHALPLRRIGVEK